MQAQAQAQAVNLSQARFRLGEYLLREPDYRQILLWAGALGMAPEAVLAELAETLLMPVIGDSFEPIGFAMKDGAIVSLAWDLEHLPVSLSTWIPGLLLRTLGVSAQRREGGPALGPVLPPLQTLVCKCSLSGVNLSQALGLTELYCSLNGLTELNLSPMPRLTSLICDEGLQILNPPARLVISWWPQS